MKKIYDKSKKKGFFNLPTLFTTENQYKVMLKKQNDMTILYEDHKFIIN